jgi:hypothetical protein
MPVPPSTIWLSREERRALVRARGQAPAPATPTTRSCLFCYGALANRSAVCSPQCDEGAWLITPTIDGEIFGAAPPEPEPEPPQRRAMTPAERQRRRRAKIRAERERVLLQLGT